MQNLFVIKAGQHLDQIMGDDGCQEFAESTTRAYENVRAVLYGRDAYLIFSEMLSSLHEAQQAQVNKVQLDGKNITHIFGFEIETISEYNGGTRIFFNAKGGFIFEQADNKQVVQISLAANVSGYVNYIRGEWVLSYYCIDNAEVETSDECLQ